MTKTLWTNADIAKDLNVSTTAVYNWSYYKQRCIIMPEPYARTKNGMALWSEEQANKIITDYREYDRKRKEKRADKQRAEEALNRMLCPQ